MPCAARQRLVKLLDGDGPVREGRERVVQCPVLHPTRAALTRRDVTSDGGCPDHRALGVVAR